MDYEKILKRIVQIINTTENSDIGFTNICTYIGENCPELQKSEDERIRKELIDYINRLTVTPNNIDRYNAWITWLEKQGNTNETINRDEFAQGVLRGAAINLITWIDCNAYEGSMCLSNVQCKEIENALVRGDWNKIYAYMKKKLEKQGEQKTTNKVEPKFHEGDYIKHNKANLICKVISVNSGSYYVENIETGNGFELFSAEQNFHLWTIADANDGDVLISENDYPFIYAGNYIYTKYLTAYCGITNDREFKISDKTELWTNDNVKPATKEQRALLFQKMHVAGYVWDEEKKEVKKIEWNNIVRDSIFDEDIDIPFGAIDSELYYQEINIPDGFQATIEGRKIILKKEE